MHWCLQCMWTVWCLCAFTSGPQVGSAVDTNIDIWFRMQDVCTRDAEIMCWGHGTDRFCIMYWCSEGSRWGCWAWRRALNLLYICDGPQQMQSTYIWRTLLYLTPLFKQVFLNSIILKINILYYLNGLNISDLWSSLLLNFQAVCWVLVAKETQNFKLHQYFSDICDYSQHHAIWTLHAILG